MSHGSQMVLKLVFEQPSSAKESRDADFNLAQRAAGGEVQARKALCQRLHGNIRRTLGYLAGLGDEADDLTQNAMVRILRYCGTYQAECTLERWADRVAIHAAIKHLRTVKRRGELGERFLRPVAAAPAAVDQVELSRVRERIAWHMAKLHPERRVAVVLHHVQGYGVDEIAAITDALPSTVLDRLYQGRRLLREWMRRDPLLREWLEVVR